MPRSQWQEVVDLLQQTLPNLATPMDNSEADLLARVSYRAAHRTKLHSVNLLERL